jgi:hypothetical protein
VSSPYFKTHVDHIEDSLAHICSGEYNRQMVAQLSESSIKRPKLKPLRLWLRRTGTEAEVEAQESTKSLVAPEVDPVKPTPTLTACMYAAGEATPAGLAMDTIAVAMSPLFARLPTT